MRTPRIAIARLPLTQAVRQLTQPAAVARTVRRNAFALAAAFGCATLSFAGTVYKIVDEKGNVTYSDVPVSMSVPVKRVPARTAQRPTPQAVGVTSTALSSHKGGATHATSATARAIAPQPLKANIASPATPVASTKTAGAMAPIKTAAATMAAIPLPVKVGLIKAIPVRVTTTKTTTTPTPSTSAPAPTTSSPAPISSAPTPVTTSPTPISSAPAPTPSTPAPSATPAPSTSTPQPTTSTPAPTTSAPAPSNAPPPATPCTGVAIAPGMNADKIQQTVDANAPGTVFCFASGTYVLEHYILLKDSDQFICPARRTCVLTGLDQYRGALAAQFGTQHHVIKGFVVEHFIAVPGQWPLAGLQARDFSLIEDNESRYNQTGIDVFSNMTVRGNYIHHNRQYGVSGGPANNILIEGNEVAWNNTAHYDPNDDASGSKIIGGQAGTSQLTWRRNYVHDNYGQGIWSDGNVRNTLYEENVIENNTGAGIDHEISWDAVIRNNILRNNNTAEAGQGKSCWHGSHIAVNNSQNIAITGNTVEAVGTNPICIVNSARHEGAVFPQFLANVSVTGNVIKMKGVVNSGLVGETLPANVTFTGNTYYVDTLTQNNWSYMSQMTRAQWQAAGHDVSGTFLTW